MNYEELLETRDVRKTTKVRLPYGYFYKRLIDGKYSNFVEFHDEVADAITFNKSVIAEHEALAEIHSKQQLHYTPNEGEDGIYAIAVEVGNYVTIEQLLNENPSMVAKGDFVISTLRDLFDVTVELHSHNIFHVCYAPSNILVRKSDGSVRLLCHGSFYEKIGPDILYEDLEGFIAPEVLAGGSADARSDVYSLGRFIAWIYQSSGLPIELRHIVEKATAEVPDNRYQTADAMRQAINKERTIRKTSVIGASALAIALCRVGFYFYLLPSTEPVEFVKPVNEPIPDDLFEDNMSEYLGIGDDLDSATIAAIVAQEKQNDTTSVDEKRMRLYNAKAEAIFRKQFTKAADVIISRVYNTESMNGEQKVFAAKSKQMTEDLAKKQQELASQTNLSNDRTQAIAAEIIENITRKKMEAMDKDYLGLRPVPEDKKSNASSVYGTTSTDVAKPGTTTTTTPSTSTSSQPKSSSSQDLYRQNRDKYGVDPYDPVDPDNYNLRKK